MTRYRVLAVGVLLALLLAPAQSWAGGRGFAGGVKAHGGSFKSGHGHRGGFKSSHGHGGGFKSTHHHPVSVFPTTVDPWKFWGHKHGHHHHHHRFFKHSFVAPGVVWGGGTAVVYAYAPPVVYASEPVAYSQPPAVYAAPMPTVVEHPTGRYELRGDGITSPYQWVWIPKPPPAPPAPPEATPELAPQSRPPAREEPSIGKIYRWTDEQGVTTFTDRLENVPKRYRPRAEPNV